MDDQENTSATEGRRRDIYLRAIARFEARGTPIDKDPRFVALIERWISGHADMTEIARAYDEIRQNRTTKAPERLGGAVADDCRSAQADPVYGDFERETDLSET